NVKNGITTNVENQASFTYSLIQGSGGSASWNTAYGINGGNNIDANPLFTADFNLSTSSPAINAGNNMLYPSGGSVLDLAGNPRLYSGTIDLGAYESNTPLSLADNSISNFSIYPVPADSTLNIVLSNNDPISGVTIYDMTGKLLINHNSSSTEINVSSLASGSYIITILGENGRYSRKFIK
ncbi:MAG TPA: T9SS type A sorting domain-containing protein, partial [Flavobacterium sp.]